MAPAFVTCVADQMNLARCQSFPVWKRARGGRDRSLHLDRTFEKRVKILHPAFGAAVSSVQRF